MRLEVVVTAWQTRVFCQEEMERFKGAISPIFSITLQKQNHIQSFFI